MGQPGSGAAGVAEVMVGSGGASLVEITLFPGETVDGDKAMGTMYVRVRGQLLKSYPACAGPPPGKGRLDRGGHTADPTGAGRYVLAKEVHYTTQSWPTSTIPWGALLRARADKEIEFSADGGATWKLATGPTGVFSAAWLAFEQRSRDSDVAAINKQNASKPGWKRVVAEPIPEAQKQQIFEGARRFFYDAGGKLPATYAGNDFGVWAWNLQTRTKSGALERTALFVHTTPPNEQESAAGRPVVLTNSHGCVHIRPADRDEMMALGYLQAGVSFVVKPYRVKGP